MKSEARFVSEMIGRKLTWLERQRFNMKLGGWLWWAIALGYVPRTVLAVPLLLVLAGYWLGQVVSGAMERAEQSLMWLGDFTKVERTPWQRAEDEPRDLWQIPRVTRALLEMGLLSEEQIGAHQPEQD